MSESSFDDKLRAHYGGQRLSDDRLALLTALAQAPVLTKPRGIFAALGLSRAAAAALLILVSVLGVQWRRSEDAARSLRDRLADLERRSQALQTDLVEAQMALRETSHDDLASGKENARYIAVRVASTKCPHCGQTAPLFEKLLEKHANDDVLFVCMDVTTPAERCQSERRACALGVEWAEAECQGCCMIRLFDRRTRQLVATQLASAPSDEFETKFDELMKKPGG